MVNPKGQGKKAAETKEDNTAEQAPVVEKAPAAEPVGRNPLDEVMGQAQRAYSAYMDATREVSRIYRENEIQVGEAYMRVVQQANEACEATIREATRDREQAETKAREAYQRAMEEAETKAQQRISDALKAREEEILKAWELREDTVSQAWEIYSKVVR